jgi:hypothetical protein
VDETILIELIEENYIPYNLKWESKLQDSAISLYEGAKARIEKGEFADLPDELIEYAQEVLKQRS